MLKKSDLTPLQQDIYFGKICPYCNAPVRISNELEVYKQNFTGKNKKMIVCKNFPHCNSYVGCHDSDGTPLGRLARHPLRIAKKEAHEAFDQLWQCAYMKRQQAYDELAKYLGLDRELCHIGMFGMETLKKVKAWSQEKLVKFRTNGET